MKIEISFDEVSALVSERYGKQVSLARVSADEVCVTYRQRVLMASLPIPINLRIAGVEAAAVSVGYNGGTAIDMIISGVLMFVKAKFPELGQAVDAGTDHTIRIDLTKIENAKAVVATLALKDIKFSESGIIVEGVLKGLQ